MLELLVAAALVIPPEAAAVAQAAVADAAVRFYVEAKVVAIQRVTWRDGSLGCPQKDMAYTQALVPGWRLTLAAGDKRFDYHASERGRVVHCPPGRAQPPLPDSRS